MSPSIDQTTASTRQGRHAGARCGPSAGMPARLAAAAVLSLLAASAAAAQPAAADADVDYQHDVAACKAGQTGEALATCMKEAGAARDLARKGKLEPASAAYASNALQRCKWFEGDERTDCEARIKGPGIISGSVAGGGILREQVTTTVGVPASGAKP